jgi:hypothetical protein
MTNRIAHLLRLDKVKAMPVPLSVPCHPVRATEGTGGRKEKGSTGLIIPVRPRSL